MKALVLFIVLAGSAHAADCTKDGRYHWSTCYGLQHALIAGAATGIVTATDPKLALPVAIGACAVFIGLELRGEGDLFDNSDRIGDWVLPCAVAGGIVYYNRETTIAPWLSDDGAGIAVRKRF